MAQHTIPRTCLVCGETFMARPIIIARGGGKYCSYACCGASKATHRECLSTEYKSWAAMKKRCLNPEADQYPDYGARGITICDAWRDSFSAFLSDVGRKPSAKHTLDRYPDNNGNYEPGNVRWATGTEQARNRRDTRLITYGGETRCLTDWANILGIGQTTLQYRLQHGWSTERVLFTPVKDAKFKPCNDAFTLGEETHSLTEWAKILGVTRGLLDRRLNKYGWRVERALTSPPRVYVKRS